MALNSNTSFSSNARHVSPRGKSLYARVQTPDTRFDDTGVYHLDLLVEPKQAQPMIDLIQGVLDEFYDKNDAIAKALSQGRKVAKASIYEEMQDGTYRFKFKQKAQIKDKNGNVYDKHVAVFDAKVKPMDEEIGNGSTVKVSYMCAPYYTPSTKTAGVSLRLVGVQVIDLVSFGDGDCGFTEEEGFTAEESSEPTAGFKAEPPKVEDDDGEDVPF